VLLRLALIGAAQGAGFTVAEMRALFDGLAPDAAPAGRWRPLAERKIAEADALIARATGMKRLLEASLRCGCVRLEGLRAAARRGAVGRTGGVSAYLFSTGILPALHSAAMPVSGKRNRMSSPARRKWDTA